MAYRVTLGLAAMFAIMVAPAGAQEWPTKQPLRVIVPLGAGSAVDIIPRTVMEQVAQQIGQSILVENRTGGGGSIGAAAVAKADPDGYTILVHSNAHTIAAAIPGKLPYDVVNDFAGITPLGNLPTVMVVSPTRGWSTVQDFVAAAKAKPGSMNYASGGTGTPPHLVAERFKVSAGWQGQHIPFKSAPEALTDVMGGRSDFYFSPILPALQLIREGKLVALAVGSSKRSSVLPDVPTTLEAGYPNSDYNFWAGMYVPAKTPRDIVDRLHDETVKALRHPEIAEKLSKLGVDQMIMTPQQMDQMVRAEVEAAGPLAQAAGIAAK
jgi:tripartite-type tricarboxylate transporter receptor subunit TctC